MFRFKMCLASVLISVMFVMILPFYAYADDAEQNEQKADISLVSESVV